MASVHFSTPFSSSSPSLTTTMPAPTRPSSRPLHLSSTGLISMKHRYVSDLQAVVANLDTAEEGLRTRHSLLEGMVDELKDCSARKVRAGRIRTQSRLVSPSSSTPPSSSGGGGGKKTTTTLAIKEENEKESQNLMLSDWLIHASYLAKPAIRMLPLEHQITRAYKEFDGARNIADFFSKSSDELLAPLMETIARMSNVPSKMKRTGEGRDRKWQYKRGGRGRDVVKDTMNGDEEEMMDQEEIRSMAEDDEDDESDWVDYDSIEVDPALPPTFGELQLEAILEKPRIDLVKACFLEGGFGFFSFATHPKEAWDCLRCHQWVKSSLILEDEAARRRERIMECEMEAKVIRKEYETVLECVDKIRKDDYSDGGSGTTNQGNNNVQLGANTRRGRNINRSRNGNARTRNRNSARVNRNGADNEGQLEERHLDDMIIGTIHFVAGSIVQIDEDWKEVEGLMDKLCDLIPQLIHFGRESM